MNQSNNPYQAPQTPGAETSTYVTPDIDWSALLAVAKAQRFVCWTLLIGFGLTIISFAVRSNPLLGVIGGLIVGVFMIAVGVLQVIAMYGLATKTYRNTASGILLAVLAFFPIIGLIALAVVNQKATEKLKAAGIRVGFMGAPQSELDRLHSLATGGQF